MHVARLAASDATRYRGLMLHAYEVAADAFTSTPEERAAQPESWWVKRIADPDSRSLSFGAFHDDDLVGTVTIAAVYYFYQYALRSSPSVMLPQLSEAFGLNALGVASMAGLFYYGYSPFSLVAGAAMDNFGPRRVLPIAAAAVGVSLDGDAERHA